MDLPKSLALYFDGSCEPFNPGGVASYGWVIDSDGAVIDRGLGVACEGKGATNNVAEYCALGFALRRLQELGWRGRLYIFGDSQLVVNQLSGSWACNREHLQKLRGRCWELLNEICPGRSWSAQWIPREENSTADELSREAYEKHTGKTYPERRNRKAVRS